MATCILTVTAPTEHTVGRARILSMEICGSWLYICKQETKKNDTRNVKGRVT